MNVILVIAEDAALCESLRASLPETDLALFENTVEDAVRRLIGIRADLVVLDDTPRLGSDALARMREAAMGAPVLVLTPHPDVDTRARLTAAGAAGVVTKPFSCDGLRDQVRALTAERPAPAPVSPGAASAPFPAPAARQYEAALRWLARISSHLQDEQRLSEALVDAMTDVYDASRCAVLLDGPGGTRVLASHGVAPAVAESVRLRIDAGLMRWFESNATLFDRAAAHAPDAAKELQVLGARVGAPLIRGGRVCGAMVVGEKSAGGEFGQADRELLSMMARGASIALENAQQYEQQLRKRQQLNVVLANVTAGVVVVGSDRAVTMMNGSAERILRTSARDAIGRSVQKLGSAFADVALRTLRDGRPRTRQQVRHPVTGETLGLSASPAADDGVVVIFSVLPQEEEQAPANDQTFSPFWEYLATRVAQEIKNPLVSVNTFAQLLPRKYDSPEFRTEFASVVQREVARINQVVDTLFDFARHPRLAPAPTDVNELVQNVLEGMQQELNEQLIDPALDLDPSAPHAGLDSVYFAQALTNVVQNAVEAMAGGGRLTIRTRGAGEYCEVSVSDTGSGVTEEDAPMIFNPFFSTKEQGMGLGLTTATRIVRQHEGELRLVPNPEGGSTFVFRVPAMEESHANRTHD